MITKFQLSGVNQFFRKILRFVSARRPWIRGFQSVVYFYNHSTSSCCDFVIRPVSEKATISLITSFWKEKKKIHLQISQNHSKNLENKIFLLIKNQLENVFESVFWCSWCSCSVCAPQFLVRWPFSRWKKFLLSVCRDSVYAWSWKINKRFQVLSSSSIVPLEKRKKNLSKRKSQWGEKVLRGKVTERC